MPDYTVGLAEAAVGSLDGARVAVLGASYRGRVKETAFSGVFPTVDALRAKGAEVLVHDPMYTDQELDKLGFAPYHLGEPVDAVIVQTDHPEYAELGREDLPGATVLIDGRDVTDAARWAGVTRIVVGRAAAPA
jgi:UDP-N-acetyl-D-mannosaminuronate dehydrogenase